MWGTLRILLGAKEVGLTTKVRPHLDALETSGMYISCWIKTTNSAYCRLTITLSSIYQIKITEEEY
ncbi:MAG: DUF3368 domain-containing protein [Chloroflexota bacterium]